MNFDPNFGTALTWLIGVGIAGLIGWILRVQTNLQVVRTELQAVRTHISENYVHNKRAEAQEAQGKEIMIMLNGLASSIARLEGRLSTLSPTQSQ